jgi:uncharacterized protein (DUF2141 family)
MSQVFTGHGVTMFSLLSLKSRLSLEISGLKGRGQTAYAIVKNRYGFKGSRKAVYDQFCNFIEQEAQKLQAGDVQEV